MERKIISVIKYFSFFAYQPTLQEIHRFLQAKINKNELKIELERLVKQKKVVKSSKYTLGEYSIGRKISIPIKSGQISKKKLDNWRFRLYLKLISLFPQIKLVGLSGSISMMNAAEEDDIDLFIITEKNRLFTARFLAMIISIIMGLKRSIGQNKAPNKVCLNLFFDENNLKVPKFKQTEFVGHEVLQMKQIINKYYTYERFLEANKWVFKLFPNAKKDFRGLKADFHRYQRESAINLWQSLEDWLENLLKKLQLKLINRHKTTEIITNSQLWFHPDDFEKKLLRHSREGGNPDS